MVDEPTGPVRSCCGQRHRGVVCPDGLVMCCICFERVPVQELRVDDDGCLWDVCRPCEEAEQVDTQEAPRGD